MVPENHNAISYIWAREKIQGLSDYGDSEPDSTMETKITKLGLDYHLMTQYTSFVAVDRKEVIDSKGKLTTVEQAIPMPQGVSNYAIGADFNLMSGFMATSPDIFSRLWQYLLPLTLGLIFAFCVKIFYQKAASRK